MVALQDDFDVCSEELGGRVVGHLRLASFFVLIRQCSLLISGISISSCLLCFVAVATTEQYSVS
jgi:hypothetical protein